jgi:hypothetical protein
MEGKEGRVSDEAVVLLDCDAVKHHSREGLLLNKVQPKK